jgi:glycosyltransferase involved in cell wall biosynthesis
MKKIGVVIPAYNEEKDIPFVLNTAGSVEWLSQIVVVNDGSTDNTLAVAQECAGKYPQMFVKNIPENQGKGAAILAGVQALRADIEVVIFMDADLIGFSSEHLAKLSDPISNKQCDMTVARFCQGRLRTDLSQRFAPNWSGQRSLPREAAEVALIPLARSGYGVEIGLTQYAKRKNWRVQYVNWEGTTHNIKEDKLGWKRGLLGRRVMYQQVLKTWLREWWQTRRERVTALWDIGT